MKRISVCSLMWAVALGGSVVCAETSATREMTATTNAVTLDGLVREALARNPELKFYQAELTAARAGRKAAGMLADPEVSGGVGQKRVTAGGFGDEGIAWSVSVMQPLEWPGRFGLRKAIANRDIELAQLGY